MDNPTLTIRIANSLLALAVCWFVSGVASGLRIRDIGATLLFFIWSLPFFAVGWALVGIPIIAMGNRILKIPKILLGAVGAAAGALIMLLPSLVFWALGSVNSPMNWAYLKGWPAFGAGIGASGVILYSWLLSREIHRTIPKPKID